MSSLFDFPGAYAIGSRSGVISGALFEAGRTAAGNVSFECPAVGRDTARRARFGLLADFDTVFDTAFGFFAIFAVFSGARLTLSVGRFARFGTLDVRRARVALAVDLALLSEAALAFLAFFAALLGAGLTFCTGRFACFSTLCAGTLFARRFILRARLGAVFDGLRYFLSCSTTLRSFFSSFVRLFSSFAFFLSLLLSRFFDAMASSRPAIRIRVVQI